MGADAIFCRRHTVLHSQQYIRSHVQEYGHAERNAGLIHKPALSSMGHQAPLESVCRHNQEQEMVDRHNADPYDCRHAGASMSSASDNGRGHSPDSAILRDTCPFLGYCLCFRHT